MATPKMEIPGAGQMGDALEFMKNLWGGMKMPGVTMPSMSVEDINKQISDLKTVESWLTLNMNMLRGTIQALEVQSATLSTLQSMGQNMSDAMGSMVQAASPKHAEPEPAAPAPQWPGAASPSSFSSRQEEPEPRFTFNPPTAEKPPAPEAEASSASEGNGHSREGMPDLSAAAAPFVNPSAWWNMLQDQFSQAVNTALEPVQGKPAAKKTAAKSGKKSPSKTASGGKSAAASKPAKKTAAKGKTSSRSTAKAGTRKRS